MALNSYAYPVVDLFAGPGGLGEGFANLITEKGKPVFNSVVSIERDDHAHQTLLLRHFFRLFKTEAVPENYYNYLAGKIEKTDLIKANPSEWLHAKSSALKISLGSDSHDQVQGLVKKRLGKAKKWVLVGGPPCQAYSLVGRSRMMGKADFEEDERHFLYREYLKIIIDHKPPVFIMENVKGLLSATIEGKPVIEKIVKDLSNPIKAFKQARNGLKYRLYSLSNEGEFSNDIDPSAFVVKAEEYGTPQARHRMFIVGIRSDIDVIPKTLQKKVAPNVKQIIGNMPKIRSGVSKQKDSVLLWRKIIRSASDAAWYKSLKEGDEKKVKRVIRGYIDGVNNSPEEVSSQKYIPLKTMNSWYYDSRLKGLTGHESRSHMETDLHRYLFASSYSEAFSISPKLGEYPARLLPDHKNVDEAVDGKMFSDRFRVQLGDKYSTTITSHISKDGHYFIHYDPAQCRSLTVREAARLQTFPDNYHFEGPRTVQYHQVGNAVPPYLAVQIAEIVKEVLDQIDED